MYILASQSTVGLSHKLKYKILSVDSIKNTLSLQ